MRANPSGIRYMLTKRLFTVFYSGFACIRGVCIIQTAVSYVTHVKYIYELTVSLSRLHKLASLMSHASEQGQINGPFRDFTSGTAQRDAYWTCLWCDGEREGSWQRDT